jgi:nitroreductase
MNETIKAIKSRRSHRQYSDKPISNEMLSEIIDCARLAPTAVNIQPWEFVVVTDKAMLKKISDLATYGKFIKNAAACIIVLCKESDYYLEDGSAATENILVAAESLCIGSCWVAGNNKAYCKEIMQILDVPQGYKIASILSLGYYDKPINPPRKRALKDMLHWEKF